MSNKKQVRFDSKPTIINDTETCNDLNKNLEDNDHANATEKFSSSENSVDGMWDKLVAYYLSRIKGLVDWRPRFRLRRRRKRSRRHTCRKNSSSPTQFQNTFAEEQIINQITEQAMKTCLNYPNKENLSDIGTFIAAGYKEGKERAARIVIRSLKYGVLTGILQKDGDTYQIRPKYFGNIQGNKPCTYPTLQKKPRCAKKHKRKEKIICCCDEKHFKRKSVSSPLPLSTRSEFTNSSNSTYDYDQTAQRRRPRRIIKKPVIPKPNRKKRGRSQTKSPTPTRSRSKSLTKYKPRKYLRSYKTPLVRRYGSILSSISSDTSICTLCKLRRKRSIFSKTSKPVKKNKCPKKYNKF